jgi:hypothetical protein
MRGTATAAGNRVRTECSPRTIRSSKVPICAAADVSAASAYRIRNNLPRHDNKRLVYFKAAAAATAADVWVHKPKVNTRCLVAP